MALTRRNTIVGLGALAAGAGVIGGTGAFTAVEADREVNLEVTGDGDALLSFTANSAIVNTDDTDTGDAGVGLLEIDVSDLNDEAITTFGDAITVENNGGNEVEFYVEGSDGDSDDIVDLIDFEAADGTNIVNTDGTNSVTLEADGAAGDADQADITIKIDLIEGDSSDLSDGEGGTIRFVAEVQD